MALAIRQAFCLGCSQGGDAGGGAPGHRPHPRSCFGLFPPRSALPWSAGHGLWGSDSHGAHVALAGVGEAGSEGSPPSPLLPRCVRVSV